MSARQAMWRLIPDFSALGQDVGFHYLHRTTVLGRGGTPRRVRLRRVGSFDHSDADYLRGRPKEISEVQSDFMTPSSFETV